MLRSTWFHELHNNACAKPFLFPERYAQYRQWAHQKLMRYIKVKQPILDDVDRFFSTYLQGYTCIGVHVRYCKAHGKEVPGGRVPELQEYYQEIDKIMSQLDASKVKIYVASDSHYAINKFKQHYPDKIVCLEGAFRDAYRNDPHLIDNDTYYWLAHPEEFHAKKPGYKGGKEALMDCLLLSKCSYLLHTASNFATFAMLFNSHVKTIVLPKTMQTTSCWLLEPERAHDRALIKNQWHLDL